MAHNHAREPFTYSPNEIAVVGLDPIATLQFARRLVTALGPERRVALVVDLDEVREDDAVALHLDDAATKNLARQKTGYTIVGRGELDRWSGLDLLGDVEIVVAASEVTAQMLCLVLVDGDGRVLDGELDSSETGIAAYVLPPDASDRLRARLSEAAGITPIVGTEDVDAAASLVIAGLEQRARSAPLYGLVLGGGRSTRMHHDKGAIDYHGMPQIRFAYRLLETYCDRVFVSNREEQADDPLYQGLEQIHDRFVGFGPMGGILSALHTHGDAAWLVLGCDLPFVDGPVLERLLSERDPLALATYYSSAHDGLPEPLCAVYEPRYRRRLHQFLASGRDCPRKALINSRARSIELADPRALDNINSPEELEEAVSRLQHGTTDGR